MFIKPAYNNSNNNNRFWYAVNNTTVVLSKSEKTIWSVESRVFPLNPNSTSFQVKETKSKHLKGLYLCVKNDETYISLCKKNSKDELNKCKSLISKFLMVFVNAH